MNFLATLPGMWERTLTVGSAGKTFSVTGWKCGWIYGPDYLMDNVRVAHQNNVYTFVTPIQVKDMFLFILKLQKITCNCKSFFTGSSCHMF